MFHSLHTKILLGFLLVITLMGVLGAWAIVSLSNIGSESRMVFKEKLEVLASLNSLDTSVSELRAASTKLLFFPDDSVIASKYVQAEKKTSGTLSRLTLELPNLSTTSDLYSKLYRVYHLSSLITNELHYQFLPGKDTLGFRKVEGATTATRAETFVSEIEPLFDSLDTKVLNIERTYLSDLESLSSGAVESSTKVRNEVILFSVVVLLLCLILSIRFAGVIVSPIKELTEKTKRITAGDLNQIVVPRTNDEIGRLGEQFNIMAEKLSEYEELNLKKILEEKAISESIVQSMEDGLVLVDRFGTVLSINRKAQDLFELSNIEGRNCMDVAKGRPAFETLCSAALRGTWIDKNREQLVEHSYRSETRFLQRDILPIQSGDALGTVAFLLQFRDVTQSYELERMRSDFVGMVSHELRTPLTAIRMSVELLGESALGPLTETQSQFVGAIKEESERLLRIVNDLMDLARIESGKFEVRAQVLEVKPFFDHLVTPFVPTAKENSVSLDVDLDRNTETIYVDPDRLKQVFVNLISNAFRYTPKGGTITIGTRPSSRPNTTEFFVRDTGAGIPPEFVPKIFQRFAIRVKDAKAGTGLGLAIAKEIVQAHGGAIHVHTEVGSGTEFWFTLPTESGVSDDEVLTVSGFENGTVTQKSLHS